MKANQFYKGTPFKAGEPRNVNPPLDLQLVEVVEDRKQIPVITRGGTKLILCYDGKAECFHLHKYRLGGVRVGGKVYNNWAMVSQADETKMLEAMARW